MLEDNRFTAIAAGLTLIIAFSFGGYILGHGLGEKSGEQQANSDTYAKHAADEIKRTSRRLDGLAFEECIVRVVETANEHERAEDDLNAQRNMAKWALFMLLATVAMAITTVFGVYYVWRTLNATQEMSADQAKVWSDQVSASLDAIKTAQ